MVQHGEDEACPLSFVGFREMFVTASLHLPRMQSIFDGGRKRSSLIEVGAELMLEPDAATLET